jgi:hypothetical protein
MLKQSGWSATSAGGSG